MHFQPHSLTTTIKMIIMVIIIIIIMMIIIEIIIIAIKMMIIILFFNCILMHFQPHSLTNSRHRLGLGTRGPSRSSLPQVTFWTLWWWPVYLLINNDDDDDDDDDIDGDLLHFFIFCFEDNFQQNDDNLRLVLGSLQTQKHLKIK